MKKLNLYIANSRVGLDRGIGKRTCKNRSVIDYFISSSSLFPFIQEFDINDFNPILSDIHNSMHISLKTCLQKQNTKHTTATQQTKSVKWNDNKRDDFVNMVHNQHNELTSILGDLENIQLNNECSQQDINNIMNKILEVFETSGKEVFTSKNKRNIFKQDSKPWYTNKCYEYRKKIHRARKTYNLHKNEPNRLHMIQCSKQYKQITNKAYNNYQFRLENELRTTSKTNSKEFWKILNSFLEEK